MGKRVKVTERGWAGHFICADRCRFRRNTLIECGEQRIVVSTVGLMEKFDYGKPWYKTGKFETIGCERYYETMAFNASKEGVYWEADVTQQLSFDSEWALNECEEESDKKANEMHDAVVRELKHRIRK